MTIIVTLLPPERATFRQASLASRRLAQDRRAAAADDDGLGVREDGRDREAAGALDVHEEGARGGHEGLGSIGLCVSDGPRVVGCVNLGDAKDLP